MIKRTGVFKTAVLFCGKDVLEMEQKQTSMQETVTVRKTTLVLIGCLCVVLAAAAAIGTWQMYQVRKQYGSLAQLAATVDANYYTDVDTDAVMKGAMKGYVTGLDDPYSRYMTGEEYESFQTNEAGKTIGIGVTVSETEEGSLKVISVSADSPAEKAEIQAEDVIAAIDGKNVTELGYTGAVEAVRGDPDTTVKLTILRGEETLELEVQREAMEVITASGQMLDNHIGYIRISSFKENTPDQFQAAYASLLSDGAEALVFDVRDNGGGLVDSLEKILDPLLPEGEIAIATYRDGRTQTLVESDAVECNLPMCVLVNENTASAAELFSASLQDFEKGTLVGVTTFGKGIMQNTQQMPDGGALTLTVATYQTTRGECYHGVGVEPDIVVEAGEATIDYDHPAEETDLQLAKAMELLREAQ